MQKPLTKQQVDYICNEFQNDIKCRVFCIDGFVVEVELKKAIERLPYDVMIREDQPVMHYVFSCNGNDIQFLSPMTFDWFIKDVGGTIQENINKATVNGVSQQLRGKTVFDDDEDGILQ